MASLRGRVVMLHAFQMLCPGCVRHGLPQAQRVAAAFVDAPLAVVGLHTVFEHHAVMGPAALDVFLQEYRVRFPVAVDQPDSSGAGSPMTMQADAMRGTPTVVLIDARGRVRRRVFGAYEDWQHCMHDPRPLLIVGSRSSAPGGSATPLTRHDEEDRCRSTTSMPTGFTC